MTFDNMKIKNIDCTLRYTDKLKTSVNTKRKNHFIGIMLSGDVLHDFGYQKFTLKENCIYFFNQKDDYFTKSYKESESFSVHFKTYEPIETDSFCIKVNHTSEIMNLLNKIQVQVELTSTGENLALSYFYKLCSIFEDIVRNKYSKIDPRMINATNYIDLHFKETDCLYKAAESSSLSRRRFNDLFKALLNVTPNHYIQAKRIDHAKQLLSNSNLSISDIAENCGFNDRYYFSKTFKKETGLTPWKYKSN